MDGHGHGPGHGPGPEPGHGHGQTILLKIMLTQIHVLFNSSFARACPPDISTIWRV